MSENLKLRLENPVGENQPDKLGRTPDSGTSADSGPIDEAESQMRKALGLLGEGQRHRSEPERGDQPHRGGDRFSGGLHRRRFVQDGDIPVTVLRRDQGHDLPAHRGTPASLPPTTSRLQRTELALAAETAAREKAERSLADVQAVAHDLQTKIGHAELARNEATEALHREREVTSQLRAEARAVQDQLDEALALARAAEHASASGQDQLAEERQAHKTIEKALRVAEAARDEAERLVRTLSQEPPSARRVEMARQPHVEPEVAAATRRTRVADVPTTEPEPVKWWLTTKPATKRR